MDHLVGPRRNNVLLNQHLDSIRRWLQKAEWTDPVGPETILDSGEDLSFEDRDEGKEGKKDHEQGDNIDQAGDDLDQPRRSAGDKLQQPSLCNHENLI